MADVITAPGNRQAGREASTGLTVAIMVQNEMTRCGLGTMLLSLPAVKNLYQCESPTQAAHCLQTRQVDALVVSCTDNDGGEDPTARIVAEASSRGVKVLFLLDSAAKERIAQATRLQADGFLLQTELTLSTLDDALFRLAQGEMPIPSTLARELLSRVRRNRPEHRTRPVFLTPREHQALLLLADGLSNKQIARRLGISEHGAKRHVANVLAKLNCPNRTLAVAMALREGLLGEA